MRRVDPVLPVLFLVLLTVTLLLPAPPVHAQEDLGIRRVGVRIGATVDPDQVHLGGHINAGEFVEQVRFQPSFELGFGDDVLVGQVNLDALYFFRRPDWSPYLGAGLGVAFIDFDRDFPRGRDDDIEVEAGLNLVGGFEWGDSRQYLLEARAGVGDLPEFKVTVGYNF